MRRLALFAFVLAIVAAGCGGGDGGGGLSQEEYVAQLDQICADFNARQDELGEPVNIPDVARIGSELQKEFVAAIRRARDLGEPPEEIADEVDRFLELADQRRALLSDLVAAAEDVDYQRIEEFAAQDHQLDEESDRLAEELGAENCAAGLAD